MDISQIDLNLLRVLRVVHATRSATLAGQRLGMTQSAVSNALRRLRERLNDPLFVRSPDGLLPTSLVKSIIGPVEAGLAAIEGAMSSAPRFDPSTSDRLYRILVNDLAQLVFIPRLITHLAKAAPHVRIETKDTSLDEGKRGLHEGSIDLALGNWPAMGANYFRQRLFSETFVVLIRREHKLFHRRLTKADYLKASHVDYRPSGATYLSFRGMLDKKLQQEGLERHVTITAAHALGLASIIAESDLLLTIPARLAASMTGEGTGLGVKPLPFSSPVLTVTQQWHARAHRDPANAWFRRQMAELFADGSAV